MKSDPNREAIEKGIISCLLHDWEKTKDLCDEFNVTVYEFEYEDRRMAFACASQRIYHQNEDDYANFLPDAGNARYYIEELRGIK